MTLIITHKTFIGHLSYNKKKYCAEDKNENHYFLCKIKMKFYSIKSKKAVDVPESQVTYRTTKNNRRQAVADFEGQKLYKFVKKM